MNWHRDKEKGFGTVIVLYPNQTETNPQVSHKSTNKQPIMAQKAVPIQSNQTRPWSRRDIINTLI